MTLITDIMVKIYFLITNIINIKNGLIHGKLKTPKRGRIFEKINNYFSFLFSSNIKYILFLFNLSCKPTTYTGIQKCNEAKYSSYEYCGLMTRGSSPWSICLKVIIFTIIFLFLFFNS